MRLGPGREEKLLSGGGFVVVFFVLFFWKCVDWQNCVFKNHSSGLDESRSNYLNGTADFHREMVGVTWKMLSFSHLAGVVGKLQHQ